MSYDSYITLTTGVKQKIRVNSRHIVCYYRLSGDVFTHISLSNSDKELSVHETPEYIDGILMSHGMVFN